MIVDIENRSFLKPEELSDAQREAINRANRTPVEKYLGNMGFQRIAGVAVAIARPFKGNSLEESIEAGQPPVFRFLPWGNLASQGNEWNQTVQTQLIADMIGRSVVAVSSPSKGSMLELSQDDRKKVAAGDFAPVAREMLGVIGAVTTEQQISKLALMGASQGATFAIATASEIAKRGEQEVSGVLASGLPNVMERSRLQLMGDFGKAGAPELYDTLMMTGVPALIDGNNLSLRRRPGKLPFRFIAGTTIKSSSHPLLALALSAGMGQPDTIWKKDIPNILAKDVPLTLVAEGKGAIMPVDSLRERIEELYNYAESGSGLEPRQLEKLQLLSIPEGDHTMSDHVPTMAGLAIGALRL